MIWRSVAKLSLDERTRALALATYGAVKLRARRVYGQDYEPDALAAREKEIEEAHARQQEAVRADPTIVIPIAMPAPVGEKPWLAQVPLRKGMDRLEEVPIEVLYLLDGGGDAAWLGASYEYVEPTDNRRRWRMEGLEVSFDDDDDAETREDLSRLGAVAPADDPAPKPPSISDLRGAIEDILQGSATVPSVDRLIYPDIKSRFPGASRKTVRDIVEEVAGHRRPGPR